MNARSFILGLALLTSSSAAVAAGTACLPTVEKAWIRAAPPGATALAGYALIRNPCSTPAAITGVTSRHFVMGMVHETVVDNGVSRMRHARSLELPARGELRLEPGGRHLMLMHPRHKTREGEKIRLVIKLADGRQLQADFEVRTAAPR